MTRFRTVPVVLVGICWMALSSALARHSAAAEPTTAPSTIKLSFAPGAAPAGYTRVSDNEAYSAERGYGFDLDSKAHAVNRGGEDPLHAGFVTADKPFFFSVKLAEGNYNV